MTPEKRQKLVKAFAHAINYESVENDSNTPDFILGEYLVDCLEAFTRTSRAREKWYGRSLSIENIVAPYGPGDIKLVEKS